MKHLLLALLSALLVLALLPGLAPAEGTGGSTNKANEGGEDVSMRMVIGDTPVQVEWEDNTSVKALAALAAEGLTIQMSMYGGFEQVGGLGQNLPREDAQTVTAPGDIVLYAGNQMVVFYGSNSWAYTRLGRIIDKTPEEMAALLGGGDVALTLTAE